MEKIFKNFETLGSIYCETHLNKDIIQDLIEDSWKALEFFFSKSFMRGRNDKLSTSFQNHTMSALKKYFNNDYNKIIEFDKFQIDLLNSKKIGRGNILKNRNGLLDSIENVQFKSLIECLTTTNSTTTILKKEHRITNGADLIMIIHVLNLIKEEKIQNIYSWILGNIKDNNLSELEKIRGNFIGDKIYSFLLRDIVLLNFKKLYSTNIEKYTFPIDTWVEQTARKLEPKIRDEEIKEFFINKSKEFKLNSLKVAAGVWLIGAKSFIILWTLLFENIEFDEKLSKKICNELLKISKK